MALITLGFLKVEASIFLHGPHQLVYTSRNNFFGGGFAFLSSIYFSLAIFCAATASSQVIHAICGVTAS